MRTVAQSKPKPSCSVQLHQCPRPFCGQQPNKMLRPPLVDSDPIQRLRPLFVDSDPIKCLRPSCGLRSDQTPQSYNFV